VKKIIIAITLSLIAATAFADNGWPATKPSIATKQTDNKFYAGLNWAIGGSFTPQLLFGFRSAKVSSNGDVYGNDVSMSVRLDKFGPGKLKLAYFDGTQNVQGEAGLGYDFASNQFLGGFGLHGPHINGGLDYLFGGKFEPYLGIDSIGRYNKPSVTCPSGYLLVNGACLLNVQ